MSPSTPVPEVLWQPTAERIERAAVTHFAEFLADREGRDFADYADLWSYSVADLAGFWGAVADYFGVRWHDDPLAVLGEVTMPGTDWFPGATLNYAEHALAAADGRLDDDLAVIAADESGDDRLVTLAELRALVGAAQAGLRRLGVGTGDRVVALAPNRLEALVGFLATAALGGVWSSCSPDFGAPSVIDRFTQIEPTVLFAVDGYTYGGKDFDISATVTQLRDALPGLTGVVHIPALGSPPPDGAIGWDQLVSEPSAPVYTPVPFAAPLWVLYSSGTTGLPKPIVQSVGGIVLEHLKTLRLHHDLGPGDRFFWFTTTGWMMWNLLIGGLLVGCTVVLYDGNPGHPDLLALWRLAERHRVTYLGLSAAFVASSRSNGVEPAAALDLSAIVTVGSTGSPLSPEGFRWVHEHVGQRVQIASLSGGTDLCTAVVGAAPTVPVWLGEISCRALGARVDSFDGRGESLLNDVGELVITAPMPSMPVAFWGDPDGKRLHAAYFEDYPGVWRHGDWIRITDRGSCVIEGRSDATLNRGGVRMGTAEFYRVVENLPDVLDSLVVDTSTPAGDGDLILFVVLEPGTDLAVVTAHLRAAVRTDLSPRHVPGLVVSVPSIPRTLNGKKCEVPIKRILTGVPVDRAISRGALADPAGFDAFLEAATAAQARRRR